MNSSIVAISCPECQRPIDLDSDIEIGQQAVCQSCNTDLVVTWLFPLCLDYLETKEPGWAYPDVCPD